MNNLYFDKNYLYHATERKNMESINKNGLQCRTSNGVTFAFNEYDEGRIYFANSLIAAYDISVNFEAHNKGEDYVIYKIPRENIKGELHEDTFFEGNGVYVCNDVKLKEYEIIDADSLCNIFKDEELEGLYD